MNFIPGIINWLNSGRAEQIDLFRKNPLAVQEKTFKSLIEKAALTEWGTKYGYSSVKSLGDYQERVPVHTYDDMIPWVDRIRNGENNLLWPGEIKWFAKSSGTTASKSKFIPMSREALEDCHYRAAKDIILLYLRNRPDSKLLSGKGLTLGGSHKINKFSNSSLYGDLSAILLENAPFWSELIKTPKKEIALLEDFEEKLAMITRTCINENVTSMSGVPSWYLVLIKQILEYTGKTNLLDVWPNLEVFFHGGISFTPYREQYRKLIAGDQMQYMETYNASEGFFGMQDEQSDTSMLLMPDYGIFYEFIPAEQAARETAAALP
ncbi:MAG: GH3 auxin-responsive promoter family protein, partial [Bacteroidales bacterium]|nr:GH3 auxin-responsive promoter family protein [Bacteroidales bacterium]